MNLNKSLSWKVLLPVGFICWLLGKVFYDSVVFSAVAFLGFILFALGVVRLVSDLIKKRKKN